MVQQFSDFMDSGAFLWIGIAGLILAPFNVLVHELGHGLAAIALTDGDVTVDVGHIRDRPPHLRIGRLSLRFSHLRSVLASLKQPVNSVPGGIAGLERGGVSPVRQAMIIVAGPAASVALVGAYALGAQRVHGTPAVLLWGLAAMCAVETLLSLVPLGNRDASALVRLIRANRSVPGGATALPRQDYRAIVELFHSYANALVTAPRMAAELELWIATISANEERPRRPGDPLFAFAGMSAGIVVRSQEGALPLPESLAAALAGGASDPLAALALERYADEVAVNERDAPIALSARFHLVTIAPTRRAARDCLRWFDIGRAFGDVVYARRSSRAAAPIAST